MFTDEMILISTEDKELFESLMSFEEQNIKVSEYCTKAFDPVPVLQAIVEFSSQVEVGLFTAWLYDYVVNKNPKKTLINRQEVTNNVTQISVIINNHVHIKQQATVTNNENNP